ncbi:MAG: hypothetical protein GTO30_21785, partial [Acidobacteria bacterium]|nr:hypothetical protein [Acidobacteriota bacterium]
MSGRGVGGVGSCQRPGRRREPAHGAPEGMMDTRAIYELPEFGPIIGVLDAVLSELNLGLFIYHLED